MSTRYHLDTEGWDTVVEMINWCLNDIDGSNRPDDAEDIEEVEAYREMMLFRDRIYQLASRMGLRKEEVPNGTQE